MLLMVIDNASEAIISSDDGGVIDLFNAGAESIFGHSRSSMQGQPLAMLVPERFRADHASNLQRFVASGESRRRMGLATVKGLRSDGQEIDLEVTISQAQLGQRQVLVSHLRDVTQELHVEAEFRQAQAQLSELTQRLMRQEKLLVKRLAQDLHDQLGQTLAAIRMSHETIVTLQDGQAPQAVNRLQAQMGKRISQAIRQVRQVLVGLRPPLLEELGLAAALDNELRNRSLSQPNLDISLTVKPEQSELRYPSDVEYAAFMVAREAIENALKHAGASSLAVALSAAPEHLQLDVRDNGVGIAAAKTSTSGHLGILGMHERAHAVGAVFSVVPDQPKGTRVSFAWSLSLESTSP